MGQLELSKASTKLNKNTVFQPLQQELLELYLSNIAEKTALFTGLKLVLDNYKKCNIPGEWLPINLKYTAPLLAELGLDKLSATTICLIM